ncbi:MAG TPA: pyridoxal phosphate-dependent aminotransferase, partial [Alphaproteobacteria bacterium]|nr:pyridoxal phosphate-dependent aminotransferase [Alphaproteobacteria bacterium]
MRNKDGGNGKRGIMKQIVTTSKALESQIDLRTGPPYAKLIRSHAQFGSVIADYFSVDPQDVIPTSGASGAIESIRNHVFRLVLKANPVLLTVTPGYWRARESFQGFGFRVETVQTAAHGFDIHETALIQKAAEVEPDLVYLSLPNNPTGAVFDPEKIVKGLPSNMPIVFDLTLPSRQLNTRELAGRLYRGYRGRRNLFLVGSTSKSHNTAEYRIGWMICASSEDAAQLRQENRNVVSSLAVEKACSELAKEAPINGLIERSFQLLKMVEGETGFKLVEPARRTQSSYVLVEFQRDAEILRSALRRDGIAVMWGSE